MEELRSVHNSVLEDRVEEALLRRVLNFSHYRPFPTFHSLRWRFLLGLLPVNVSAATCRQEWEERTHASIDEWKKMNDHLKHRLVGTVATVSPMVKRGYFSDSDSSTSSSSLHGVDDDGESLVVENPLRPHAGSSYALRFFVDTVRTIAQKDIDRLHWEFPLFEAPTTQNALIDILVNYCLRYNCDYRQGMHEIVAFVFYLTHSDAVLLDELLNTYFEGADGELVSTFKLVCPTDGVVALAYVLFEAIMGVSGLRLYKWYYTSDDSDSNNIVGTARKIQHELLAQVDKELFHQMNVVYNIEGTTYLIRWLRLLFLREFSILQCAELWGVFLSERLLTRDNNDYTPVNSSITMFAASMLLFVKEDLMLGCIDALKRLMKYPPLEDLGFLVGKTVKLVDPNNAHIGRYFTSPEQYEFPEENKSSVMDEKAGPPTPPATTISPTEVMKQEGKKLASIIERLESIGIVLSTLPPEDVEDVIVKQIRSIEELKSVRDALLSFNGTCTQH